jgi:hypothetical protein
VAAVLCDPYRHLRQQRARAASVQEALLEIAALEQLEDGGYTPVAMKAMARLPVKLPSAAQKISTASVARASLRATAARVTVSGVASLGVSPCSLHRVV